MGANLDRASHVASAMSSREKFSRLTLLLLLFIRVSAFPKEAASAQTASAKRGTLTASLLESMGTTVEFDINLIRIHPEILENREMMRYFVALNNCQNPAIIKTINNELDYPKLAEYYRSNAAQIVSGLPSYIGVALYGGVRSHGDNGFTDFVTLGEYDTTKGAFPFVYHPQWGTRQEPPAQDSSASSSTGTTVTLGSLFKKKRADPAKSGDTKDKGPHVLQIQNNLEAHYNRENLRTVCPAANTIARESGSTYGMLPSQYSVTLEPTGFDSLPMPEADARQYIESHPPTNRQVYLSMYVGLSGNQPPLDKSESRGTNDFAQIAFSGHIAKVEVTDQQSGRPIGTLVDDHSIPNMASASSPAQPTPAPTTSGTQPVLPAINNRIAISTAAFVMADINACHWTIAKDQSANLQRFIAEAGRTSPNSPQVISSTENIENRRIASVGTATFCSSSIEKMRFDRLVATLWPKGQVAAPESNQ